ncbi:MAG: AzlC family ABC transporter permease [Selenomonadaceae bacterium]|nr:AzlC family ABC transporter permease [Selenomonadaceae bacterium]
MTGFCFLGLAYGIYMNVLGFGVLYPTLMAALIFGGSLEFVAATMLLAPFAPIQTFAVAVMIQARHLFYGLAMLEKYKGLGLKRQYLIFGLCDETFAINCSTRVPSGIDRGWFYFWVTLLNQSYWVTSAMLGGLLGEVLTFNTEGLGFVMTAMFVVIWLEQFLTEGRHVTSLIGFAASMACLIAFGSDSFLIPSMVLILIVLTAFRLRIER